MRLVSTQIIETAGRNGYSYYRIPGIVVTDRGTLIAYYESRHGGDWSVIDICMRRSTDGGNTWEERRTLFPGMGKNTVNNPVMIPDGDRIHLLCLENYKRLFHMVSCDEGTSWSGPEEITRALEEARERYPWTCAAVGPGHGVRLASGRLLASVWLASDLSDTRSHHPSRTATIYSDDGGAEWHMGGLIDIPGAVSPNEACLALIDGGVLINARTRRPEGEPVTAEHFRALAVSGSGIDDWHDVRIERQLPDPVCQGGMANCPSGVLFTNCDSFASRSRHTLRLSKDGGRTWDEGLMYNELAGYSDVCFDERTGSAFVFYEHDNETQLRVSRIEL